MEFWLRPDMYVPKKREFMVYQPWLWGAVDVIKLITLRDPDFVRVEDNEKRTVRFHAICCSNLLGFREWTSDMGWIVLTPPRYLMNAVAIQCHTGLRTSEEYEYDPCRDAWKLKKFFSQFTCDKLSLKL